MIAIEQRLRATGLFEALDDGALATVAAAVEPVDVAPGDVVVREGDPEDALYVIADGTAQVFTFGQDGREVVLAKIGEGEHFGEQALEPGRSERRNANVRAFSPTRLLRLAKDRFERALPPESPLRRTAAVAGEQQLFRTLSDGSALLSLLRLEEGAGCVHTEHFEPGATVFRQGDPGDRFYVILSGAVAVFREEGGGAPKLIVRLGEGQCFGELALIHRQPRATTVFAVGALDVLTVAGERFLHLYETVPALRQYVQALEKGYSLPGRGFATQHAGEFEGQDAIATVYHLARGLQVVASRVIGRDIYNMAVLRGITGEPRTIRFDDPKTGDARELAIADQQLVGVTAWGSWQEIGDAHRMILEARRLEPWQEEVFRARGSLRLEEDATFYQDDESICSCLQVTRGTLRRAIQDGCATAAALGECTGAGTVCGACTPRLRDMIGRADWPAVKCVGATRATDEIRSFRFKPFTGTLKPAKAGQHVIVQARIDDRWIQRPYTLSSAASETQFHEITVKREARGLFSSWLFDQMRTDALIRISPPQGQFVLDDAGEDAPVVCFVGGIGMTPALAMVRTVVAEGVERRLHVDYSCSRLHQFAYLDELREAAGRRENITLTARTTREEGHIRREDVAAVAADLPGAVYFICGPKPFQDCVASLLAEVGVPRARVRIEEFTPQGNKPERGGAGAAAAVAGRKAASAPSPVPPGARRSEKPPVPEILASQPGSVSEEAHAYLQRFYFEKGAPQAMDARWREVAAEVERTGTYAQTYDEITFGAKLAWRNSTRCIGRLFWQGLQVRDMRHLAAEDEIFESLCEHIRLATNGGNLRAVISVFRPERPGEPAPRIWNPQLVRYAGYRQADGSWIGDPGNEGITRAIQALGWSPGEQTHFDVLPLVIQLPGRAPKLYPIPKDLVLEVPLTHPEHAWFAELGLRWHALPAVADMLFDCGGVRYTFAPFNGWYMGTEIGARNLSDEHRYNMLPTIAQRLGLDAARDRTLWKDRALVELNIAVLHSYEQAGVKMVDHHTAANEFMEFAQHEGVEGRRVDARWSWIVPPMSGATTPVFHVGWRETVIKPNYFYQAPAYSSRK